MAVNETAAYWLYPSGRSFLFCFLTQKIKEK